MGQHAGVTSVNTRTKMSKGIVNETNDHQSGFL